ncbi:MAG: DUF4129 domain-containing protein [Cyanobacteria bacterium P01_C01_bin.72]
MSAGSFKQDGLGWRISLIRQRLGEWIEYRLSKLDLPDWEGESWELSWLWQVIKFFLWSILAILLILLLWQLWLLIRPYWKRWQRPSDRHSPFIPQPQTPQLSVAEWLERSQSARIEGNYRQAIFCLYQAMLRLLDERGIVPSQPSFTDEEYRRSLLKIQISPLTPYELLLSIHQRLCFSSAEADRAMFEECQQAFEQIAN